MRVCSYCGNEALWIGKNRGGELKYACDEHRRMLYSSSPLGGTTATHNESVRVDLESKLSHVVTTIGSIATIEELLELNMEDLLECKSRILKAIEIKKSR